jgi:hypothetical protein
MVIGTLMVFPTESQERLEANLSNRPKCVGIIGIGVDLSSLDGRGGGVLQASPTQQYDNQSVTK